MREIIWSSLWGIPGIESLPCAVFRTNTGRAVFQGKIGGHGFSSEERGGELLPAEVAPLWVERMTTVTDGLSTIGAAVFCRGPRKALEPVVVVEEERMGGIPQQCTITAAVFDTPHNWAMERGWGFLY